MFPIMRALGPDGVVSVQFTRAFPGEVRVRLWCQGAPLGDGYFTDSRADAIATGGAMLRSTVAPLRR